MMSSAEHRTQINHTPSYDADGRTPTVSTSIMWGILIVAVTLPTMLAFTAWAAAWQVRVSAWLAVIAWTLSIRDRLRSRSTAVRWWWTVGCGWQWLHVAIAFEVVHAWSHQSAWEHTRQIGGIGDGIYVNYVFSIVWLFECLLMWVAKNWIRRAPRWWRWGIQIFMGFVIVQATFVFGTNLGRVIGCGVLFGLWLTTRRGLR